MREWTLSLGDPLAFTLAADFRLCTPNYADDHIWELETGGGDPPALSLRTTYGLRARIMRIFPRFAIGDYTVSNPVDFPHPPRLRYFYPNFLSLDFSPIPDIDVVAEYWIPDSHSAAGRFTITNHGSQLANLHQELCGQLVPMDGQSLTPLSIQSANILTGRTANLSPVIFLSGGPQFGPGPFPSLTLNLTLTIGESRTLTWAQAALTTPIESFKLAKQIAAHPWEAERVKIELVNVAQTIDVLTGNPDWDAAFALSQKTAFGLFFGPSQHLPYPSFVLSRQPDHGYSPCGDGSDYPHVWSGQSPLEAYTLANLLPGAPDLVAGLVRNFIAGQSEDGTMDWKPGLAGQRGHWLATPLLSNLAWQTFQQTRDMDFLVEVQPGLEAFIRCWFKETHDRDGDGFPEWDHPLQTGFDDYPAFTPWQAGCQGADISTVESPALAAMLFQETRALAHIAASLNQQENHEKWESESELLRLMVEECWDSDTVLYHLRDRDTHYSPVGKTLGTIQGSGRLILNQSFQHPIRLVVRLELAGGTTHRPEISLRGRNSESPQTERLERSDFLWGVGLAVATSRMIYTSTTEIEVSGLDERSRVTVSVMDFSAEDVTLFLPLWAGIPNHRRVKSLVKRTLFSANRFGGPFGIPTSEVTPNMDRGETSSQQKSPHVGQTILLPWNTLIGKGLVDYGFQEEAVRLTSRLMSAIIQNLKKNHAFSHSYNVENGVGIGERNTLQGLAPLGLFLYTLGVRIESPKQVVLSGKNPFPWSVTVKYRGLTVTRHADQTLVVFPDGQNIELDDPTDAVISVLPVPGNLPKSGKERGIK